jgi:hypothetical protein
MTIPSLSQTPSRFFLSYSPYRIAVTHVAFWVSTRPIWPPSHGTCQADALQRPRTHWSRSRCRLAESNYLRMGSSCPTPPARFWEQRMPAPERWCRVWDLPRTRDGALHRDRRRYPLGHDESFATNPKLNRAPGFIRRFRRMIESRGVALVGRDQRGFPKSVRMLNAVGSDGANRSSYGTAVATAATIARDSLVPPVGFGDGTRRREMRSASRRNATGVVRS